MGVNGNELDEIDDNVEESCAVDAGLDDAGVVPVETDSEMVDCEFGEVEVPDVTSRDNGDRSFEVESISVMVDSQMEDGNEIPVGKCWVVGNDVDVIREK